MCTPSQPNQELHMADQLLVIRKGPYAGLYVSFDGKTAYVKNETRPYAPLSDNILYDSRNDLFFYTSSPHTFNANPAYIVAPQCMQDKYAYYYQGNMPYCNGVVHEVKNNLTTAFDIITDSQLQKVSSWLFSRRPNTPDTAERVKSFITPTNGEVKCPPPAPTFTDNDMDNDEDWFVDDIDIEVLLADFAVLI